VQKGQLRRQSDAQLSPSCKLKRTGMLVADSSKASERIISTSTSKDYFMRYPGVNFAAVRVFFVPKTVRHDKEKSVAKNPGHAFQFIKEIELNRGVKRLESRTRSWAD
jgi:hypothetical protein